MKILKKISLIIIIFMLSTTLKVFASDGSDAPTSTNVELNFTSDLSNVKTGDTVKLTLSGKCETGISGVDSTLEWDKTKLELTNQQWLESQTMSGIDASTNKFKLSVLASSAAEEKTDLVTLEFKVLSVAEGETITVTLSEIEVYDTNLDSVEVSNKTVTLTGPQKQTNQGNGNQDKTPSGGNIPHAGIEDVGIVLIPATLALSIMFYIKYKKYGKII